jgi:hypothetical protein
MSATSAPVVASSISIQTPGIYSVAANSGTQIITQTIAIGSNTVIPGNVISSLSVNITCTLSSVANVTMLPFPTVGNYFHYIIDPSGATFIASTSSIVCTPQSTGVYTYVVTNLINGCTSKVNFTVNSSQGLPSFNLKCPTNFILGCRTNSAAVVTFSNYSTSPPGNSMSFTVIPPGSSTLTPSGILGSATQYTISSPGDYIAIAKDNNSLCEHRSQFTVLNNLVTPTIDCVSNSITNLNCIQSSATLTALLLNKNISLQWSFYSNNNQLNTLFSNSVVVNTNNSSPTTSLISNYSLTLINNDNLCQTTSVYPMYQDLTGCVGISKNYFNQNNISIYPNPSDGYFVIEKLSLSENTKVEIYNSLGLLVESMNLNEHKTHVSLTDKMNGVYFIRIKSNQNYSETYKVIKN